MCKRFMEGEREQLREVKQEQRRKVRRGRRQKGPFRIFSIINTISTLHQSLWTKVGEEHAGVMSEKS